MNNGITANKRKRFVYCFYFNDVTCSFVTCIEQLLNEICLVDVVGCTLNICFLGFNMMTVRYLREIKHCNG